MMLFLTPSKLYADPKSESRTSAFFIPPDERFPHTDFTDFGAHTINAFANLIVPEITEGSESAFKTFEQIEQLYVQGFQSQYNSPSKLLEHNKNPLHILKGILEAAKDNPLIDFVRPQVYEGQNVLIYSFCLIHIFVLQKNYFAEVNFHCHS